MRSSWMASEWALQADLGAETYLSEDGICESVGILTRGRRSAKPGGRWRKRLLYTAMLILVMMLTRVASVPRSADSRAADPLDCSTDIAMRNINSSNGGISAHQH
jgi:hypothetical protein